jgi:hypothetical protein
MYFLDHPELTVLVDFLVKLGEFRAKWRPGAEVFFLGSQSRQH